MGTLTPRPGIMDIAPYKGGMSKDTSFKGKLSSNESALGPSPAAVDAFKQAAMGQFGSGWAWVVRTSEGVDIMTTGNADTPFVHGKKPLLTLDVWEHAYYLDFQNRRDAYIDTFLDSLVNWEFATANYRAA